jgi:hypothetical protein
VLPVVSVAIVALALALRLVFLAAHPGPLTSDARDYDELGWTLAHEGRYAVDGKPTAYRAPAYPAFIAAVYAAAGRRPHLVQTAQAVLDSLTALLLLALLARRNRVAATIAGFAWALFPAAILLANSLFSETLFAFGIVLFAWLVCRDRPGSDLAAGAVLGALILTKPMMLLFAAALPLALSRRSAARPTTAILLVALLPVLAWMGRNVAVMGTPALVTSTGTNLLIGHNPSATGGYAVPAAGAATAPVQDEVRADLEAGARALAYAANDPLRTLGLGVRKVMLLSSSEAELAAGAFTHAATGARLRDRYQALPFWLRTLVSLPTLAILLLGVFGLATRGAGIETRLFLTLLFAIAISSFVFFGGSRFRFPLMPFLVLFGAEFAAAAGRRLHVAGRGRIVAAAAACAGVAAVWIGEALVLSGALSL